MLESGCENIAGNAEVVSNSRDQLHPTTYKHYFRAQYLVVRSAFWVPPPPPTTDIICDQPLLRVDLLFLLSLHSFAVSYSRVACGPIPIRSQNLSRSQWKEWEIWDAKMSTGCQHNTMCHFESNRGFHSLEFLSKFWYFATQKPVVQVFELRERDVRCKGIHKISGCICSALRSVLINNISTSHWDALIKKCW